MSLYQHQILLRPYQTLEKIPDLENIPRTSNKTPYSK